MLLPGNPCAGGAVAYGTQDSDTVMDVTQGTTSLTHTNSATSNTTIDQILKNFQRYDNTFGLPYLISSACYVKKSAPCFENPMEIYGYYYPNSYWVGY